MSAAAAGGKGKDAKFFQTQKEDKELKDELNSQDKKKQQDAVSETLVSRLLICILHQTTHSTCMQAHQPRSLALPRD